MAEIKEYRRPTHKVEDWTTNDFLNELMHRYDVKTDYALHHLLKVKRQTIYRYRANRGTFDTDVALRVAELLPDRVTPDVMLVITAFQRERLVPARALWHKLLKRLAATATAAALLLAVQFALFTDTGSALIQDGIAAASTDDGLYLIRTGAAWLAVVACGLLLLWLLEKRYPAHALAR